MKQILLFVGLLFSTSIIYSQEIKIVDKDGNDIRNDTIFLIETVDTTNENQKFENAGFAAIINNSSSTMTIKMIRYEGDVVSGTGDAICWGQTCYGRQDQGTLDPWFVGDSVVVAPGDTAGGILGGLVTYHFPSKQTGKSTYRYSFYNSNNTLGGNFDLSVQYVIDLPTSINETFIKNSDLKLFPNPSENQLSFSLNASKKVDIKTIEIKNVTGKTVLEKSAPFLNQSFNVGELASGIYFINFNLENQNRVTKKFIKR